MDFSDKNTVSAMGAYIKGKIPTALPADGGDADTVDGMHANGFITGETIQQRTTIDDCITGGTYAVSPVYTTDIPAQYGNWGICDVRVYGLGVFQIIKYTDTANVICRSKIVSQTEWSEWKRINDGGNADTVGGMKIMTDTITVNSDGAGYVWLPYGNARKYISVIAHSYVNCDMYVDAIAMSTNLYIPDAINKVVTIDITWIE